MDLMEKTLLTAFSLTTSRGRLPAQKAESFLEDSIQNYIYTSKNI